MQEGELAKFDCYVTDEHEKKLKNGNVPLNPIAIKKKGTHLGEKGRHTCDRTASPEEGR